MAEDSSVELKLRVHTIRLLVRYDFEKIKENMHHRFWIGIIDCDICDSKQTVGKQTH